MKVAFSFLVLSFIAASYGYVHPLSDEFIDLINSKQTTWKAGRNFHVNASLAAIKGLNGVLPRKAGQRILPLKIHAQDIAIPAAFDAREAWPQCADVIGNVRDQASCGSCWAFAAVEAMSDRICIVSDAKQKVSISAEDLNDCCVYCGYGCSGGYPDLAWYYFQENGIVTGGAYETHQGCKTYALQPCEHHTTGARPSCTEIQPTPRCLRSCDADSSLSYSKDLKYGVSAYTLQKSVTQIQAEVLTNGPVEAAFTVYEDFLTYKSGVYQHVEGGADGGHAVKIVGWGEENGVPYWTIINSWNNDWGDHGEFKMLRGSNECGIEEEVTAGIPEL